jgi:hypothetical protein
MRSCWILGLFTAFLSSAAFATKVTYCLQFDVYASYEENSIGSARCSVNQNITDVEFTSGWDCDFDDGDQILSNQMILSADGIGYDFNNSTYFAQYFISPERGLGEFFFQNLNIPTINLLGYNRFEVYFFNSKPGAPIHKLYFQNEREEYMIKITDLNYSICESL